MMTTRQLDLLTANSCSGASWQPVNDVNSVMITGLTFDLSGSTCINVSEPDDEEDGGDAGTIDDPIEYDCFAVTPDTDDALTLIREVAITLSAQLSGDSLVRASMNQTVRVRNDLVRIQP